jgi:hypothetical protein
MGAVDALQFAELVDLAQPTAQAAIGYGLAVCRLYVRARHVPLHVVDN